MDLQTIWNFENYETYDDVKEAGRVLYHWLKAKNDKISTYLIEGDGDISKKSDMHQLEKDILEKFSPVKKSKVYLQAFSLVVNKGIANNIYDICPPSIPTYVKRARSPFTIDRLPDLSMSRMWEALILNTSTAHCENNEVKIGHFLAAAALKGGLLNAKSLLALYSQLMEPVTVIEDQCVIELKLEIGGLEGAELRRWFLDPVSEILFCNITTKDITELKQRHSNRAANHNDIFRCIKKFFTAAELPKTDLPNTLTKFVNAISFQYYLTLPSCLTYYAGRNFSTHSLCQPGWNRLHGHQYTAEGIETENPAHLVELNDIDLPEEITNLDIEWLKDIRFALRRSTKHKARNKLRSFLQQYEPESQPAVFAGWALHLVRKGSIYGNSLKLKTIYRYLPLISKHISGQIPVTVDLTTMTHEEYYEVYQQVLDGAHGGHHRRMLVRGLREFHHYLHITYKADPLEKYDLLRMGNYLSPVDANIISFDEYEATLKLLDNIDLDFVHEDLPTICKIIMILGFKCGLRRMEALKLLNHDLHDIGRVELLVRPHEYRGLKTRSATRKLPLYVLLNTDDLDLISEFAAKRRQKIRESGCEEPNFLFSIPDKGYVYVPEETIFPILHKAMRAVTGDESIRFHHLRHSFASWTFLRLILADLKNPRKLFQHLPVTSKYLEESKKFKDELYQYTEDNTTRRHLYAIASLLGHSEPGISLEHYIHFCDIACAVALECNSKGASKGQLIKLSGVSKATASRWVKGGGMVEFFCRNRMRGHERVVDVATKKPEYPLVYENERYTDESMVTVKRIWDFLYFKSARNLTLEELSRRFGFDNYVMDKMANQAAYIRDLRTGVEKKGYRHRMKEIVPDVHSPDKKIRLLCPRWPSLTADRQILAELLVMFFSLDEGSYDNVALVLAYYVEKSWQNKNELIFKDHNSPEMAKMYCDFLEALGIKNRDIEIFSYDSMQRSIPRGKWRDKLLLTKRHPIKFKAPPNKNYKNSKKWIGIKPTFPDQKLAKHGSEGFRFFMVMASIYFNGLILRTVVS